MSSVVLVGGGSSIKPNIPLVWDTIKTNNIPVWSINFAYKWIPYNPTRQIWSDKSVWDQCAKDFERMYREGVSIVAKERPKFYPDWVTTYKVNMDARKVSEDLFVGLNGLSGLLALSLAIREGFTNIYLLGYDAGTTNPSDKNTHWYMEHAEQQKIISSGFRRPVVYLSDANTLKNPDDYQWFAKYYDRIYNVSLSSNIHTFKKISYQDFYDAISINK